MIRTKHVNTLDTSLLLYGRSRSSRRRVSFFLGRCVDMLCLCTAGEWRWKQGILHVLLETCMFPPAAKGSAENVANLLCLVSFYESPIYSVFDLRAHAPNGQRRRPSAGSDGLFAGREFDPWDGLRFSLGRSPN
jgi:hypothetical protein